MFCLLIENLDAPARLGFQAMSSNQRFELTIRNQQSTIAFRRVAYNSEQ
jgi:hypothetical protein